MDLDEFRALHQQLFPHADDASVRRAFATVDLEGRGKVDMIDWCNRIKLQHMPSIVERIRRHGEWCVLWLEPVSLDPVCCTQDCP